jgi:beta-lactamase class A
VPTAVAGVTAVRPPDGGAAALAPEPSPALGPNAVPPGPAEGAAARPTEVDPGQRLVAALRQPLDGPADLRLVVEHVASGARFEHEAAAPAPSASVYKLFVAHEVLERAGRGEVGLDDGLTIQAADALEEGWEAVGDRLTVRQALEAAMGQSSNRAAYALLRLVGRARLNARLVDLGLRRSSVPLLSGQRPLPGSPPLHDEYATSTPADLAELLRLVATGRTLTPESRAELRRLLALEETVEPLRRSVPSGTLFAKNGWLPGVRNVAALVDTPTGPVVLAAFAEAGDDPTAEAALAQIGRAVVEAYGRQPAPG